LVKEFEASKNKDLKNEIMEAICALSGSLKEKLSLYISNILPIMFSSSNEKDNNEPLLVSLRIFRLLFKNHRLSSDHSYLKQSDEIVKFLLFALNHKETKIMTAGLSVAGLFLCTLL